MNNYPPTREELEYTRAMALLGAKYEPLGDDLSDYVYALQRRVKELERLGQVVVDGFKAGDIHPGIGAFQYALSQKIK